MDLDREGLESTLEILENRGFSPIGTGSSLNEASKFFEVDDEGNSYIFPSFGWKVIQCQKANKRTVGVNPLNVKNVIGSVLKTKRDFPESILVVLFHWNYEMEKYPQPRHRELARKLIDIGADLIIGHHPHIVNGIEVYNEKTIVNSLGNWFIPHNFFFNVKLRFSDWVTTQLIFEWSLGMEPVLHWFDYSPLDHSINYSGSEAFSESPKIKELTPFHDMSHIDYIKWFKKNRKKKTTASI